MDQDREPSARPIAAQLRGLSRLAIEAVSGVTDLVEAMHANIAGLAAPLGKGRGERTSGLTGLVYGSVRGVTRLVGHGLDAVLAAATPLLRQEPSGPRHAAVLAALNGVCGDHLHASGNPLAIPMRLQQGQPASQTMRPAELACRKVLLLVHGLCMNPQQWTRSGHDHGMALAAEHGYTPVYLHYNSGRHIADNGAELARLLQQCWDACPEPPASLSVLAHSMGGLVARSAIAQAEAGGLAWRQSLRKLVFLGSPQHGAPLERLGNWADTLLALSPYSAPFLRLGGVRSAGITDLRFGQVLEPGSRTRDRRDRRRPVALPADVDCHAIAGSIRRPPAEAATRAATRVPGDGLVPVTSALGQHRDPAHDLGIPESRRLLLNDCGHFDLLDDPRVYARLREWLALGC